MRRFLCFALLLIAACSTSEDESGTTTALDVDSSVSPDSTHFGPDSQADAGVVDSHVVEDSAVSIPDAGPDAEPVDDLGASDGGVEDIGADDAGGETPDVPDTSAEDAGQGGDDALVDAGVDAAVDGTEDAGEDAGPVLDNPTAAECFGGQMGPGGEMLVDYDQYAPSIGNHCKGTKHQEIQGVERVVFVGDSITVGTPPTAAEAWYRNVMAAELAETFGLEAPDWSWQNVDLIKGVAYSTMSGDFAVCAKWGARTDDILKQPHQQLPTCIPDEEKDKTTLVVMTVGGNDIFAWAQDMVAGEATIEELWVAAEKAVGDLEAAIHWLVDDPEQFPAGVFVVFANTFEFTDVDSGNDFATCPGADIISMDTALVDPEFSAMVAWMMSEYLRIAVETGTDMAFMGEHTCGHGHMFDNPEGRCYRGAGTPLWLDITCMHPSAAGHAGIADLFLSVILD